MSATFVLLNKNKNKRKRKRMSERKKTEKKEMSNLEITECLSTLSKTVSALAERVEKLCGDGKKDNDGKQVCGCKFHITRAVDVPNVVIKELQAKSGATIRELELGSDKYIGLTMCETEEIWFPVRGDSVVFADPVTAVRFEDILSEFDLKAAVSDEFIDALKDQGWSFDCARFI